MSKCDLRIELERADRRYAPGETVRGKLVVSVNARCECKELTLTRLWRTHGRGNRASGGEEKQVLYQGSFRPGETLGYPFEVRLPAGGPLTYHGHYLNVDWYLQARADVPWAIDPKTEEELLVELSPETQGVELAQQEFVGGSAATGNMPPIVGLLFASIFGLSGLGIMMAGLFLMDETFETLVMVPFGGIFAAVGLFVGYLGMRNSLAERKLGPVLVELEPRRLRPGDELSVHVHLQPLAPVPLNGIKAKLVGKEVVISGSGTNRTTHTHELHGAELVLCEARELQPGEDVDLRVTTRLPQDAPYSFSADDNKLVWQVEVHLDVARWPDWSRTHAVNVAP